MSKIKIGILREGKIPIDKRTPLTPYQARELMEEFDNIEVVCQSSPIRCFEDHEYTMERVPVVDNVVDCDILLGVKEVPIHELIENKTYLFFSHTIKEQEYNRELLREILRKNIRLIDYECLTDSEGVRIIAFGRYAGIVGAYNGIWAFGQRYNLFNLRRASECEDLEEMKTEYSKVELPPIKIVLTGGGRVAKGSMEVMNGMGIKRVSPAEFLHETFDFPVYTQLNSWHYNKHKEGIQFNRQDFHKHPFKYESDFHKYSKKADILIAGAYWDPNSPVLFHREDMIKEDFKIKVIADITMDIEGSIPSTKRPATIEDPLYDYDPSEDTEVRAFVDEGNITVMAVDNLPCELPKDASIDFGDELVNNVLPFLVGKDSEDVIKRATITENGKLTPAYKYLQNFVDGE